MKQWILFPKEDAFYIGMGRELYEMDQDYRSFCRSAEKALKLPLHKALFYREAPYPAPMYYRQAAVMTISLANFRLFRKTYPAAKQLLLCGQGMGLLTALVAAEALSLETAAGCLRGKLLSPRQLREPKLPVYARTQGWLRKKDAIVKAVAEALQESAPWALPEEQPCLDIGPGRTCFDALSQGIIARMDEPGDPQYLWSGIQCKRLWNRDYCAKRLFGIFTATPNRNHTGSGDKLHKQENELRKLLEPLFAQPPQSISQEVFDRCLTILRESFTEKHTPMEEITQRFRLLEQETLISLPIEE